MFRYEKKYQLTPWQMTLLKDRLEFLSCLDPYCKNGRPYDVLSLYFDTPQMTFYWQKVEGMERQLKFRLRSYNRSLVDYKNLKLEYKEKYQNLQYKGSRALHVIEGTAAHLTKTFSDKLPLRFQKIAAALTPVVKVYYQRLAYYIPFENEKIRINFDFNINSFYPNEPEFIQYSHGPVVLEIKSQKLENPWWLDNELVTIGANRTSFSKYVYACNAKNIASC